MSTESETKSAGVPAGATHRCAVEGCGIYYRQIAPFHYVTVPRRGRACTHFLRPIAEAGPAPTTAAPAEQLSGKVICRRNPLFAHQKDSHYTTGDRLCVDPRPAEQPGKAADPRPGEVLCDKPSYKHGGSHPKKVTCVDPRPAQPQAPAEPTKEQIEKAGRVLAAVMVAERRGENMDPIIARALAAEAAPLREERDRLAAANRSYAEEVAKLREDQRIVCAQADTAEAKVAERDARIVQMRTELLRGVLHEHPLDGSTPKPWHTLACPRCMIHASSTNPLCLRHEIAAALGAPEGQRPAAPSEAPRHCRICEEPMSDTCEECQ